MTGRQRDTVDRVDESSLPRLISLLRPYPGRMVAVLIMLVGLTAVNIAVPRLVGIVLDQVFKTSDWTLLWIILWGLLTLYVIRNVLYFFSKYTAVSIGENVSFQLRKRLFERLQQMNLHYYRQNKPGQLSSRVMNDSYIVQQFIQDQVPKLLQASLLFLGILAMIYAMNWQLAVVSTVVLPLHLITYNYFKSPIRHASRSAQEHMASATGNLIEKFLGVEVVKGFTGEARENEAFEQAIDLSRQSQLRTQKFYLGQKIMADFLIGLGMIALIGVGAYEVMGKPPGQRMEVGAFVSFFMYIRMLYPTVIDLMGGFAKLSRTGASIERVFEMLELQHGQEHSRGSLRPAVRGQIRLEQVKFAYPNGPKILDDVSFSIEAGTVCAIVGPSGAGKSTFVNLLPRFLDAQGGRILIDGLDIQEFDLHYLREHIGFAFQECFLFGSSIIENLRYAQPDATREQIIAVARRTLADDFIRTLPQGYDTVVGEQGVNISRGEKQLISLTRAVLKDPQILILDEATASVDAEREGRIVPEILKFMEDRTVLMVTHRAEMLKHADVVLRVGNGHVLAEPGPLAARSDGDQRQLDLDEREDVAQQPESGNTSSGTWSGMAGTVAAVLLAIGLLMATPRALAAPATQPTGRSWKAWFAHNSNVNPPSDAGRFLSEPGMSNQQVSELLDVASGMAEALGYEPGGAKLFDHLPAGPKKLKQVHHLVRQTAGGLRLLEIGFRPFVTQPPHVWLYGVTLGPKSMKANADVNTLAKRLTDSDKNQKQMHAVSIANLSSHVLTLSYVAVDRCLGVLKALGYNVVEFKNGQKTVDGVSIEPTGKIDPSKLPLVMAMPTSDDSGAVSGDQSKALPDTLSGRMMELLVFYSPKHPEQLGHLEHLIKTAIDVPARQIVIEAMVLEISNTALNELGVQWQLQTPWSAGVLGHLGSVKFGQLPDFQSSSENPTTPALQASIGDISHHWRAEIQALVQQGKAQILSRPSVLTLNDRQAYIHVGQQIPIATTITGLENSNTLSFNFHYEPVGISLNVRPRVSANGQEVSMQINGQVSAEVPGGNLVIRNSYGNVLASAPTLSERNVETYTRIANNTPFIIGGLISKDNQTEENKVPLLGDIPIVGNLFRSTSVSDVKREVIIVITPYVLPQNQVVGRNLPKGVKAFDSFGNKLFRNAYRIRSEDVFDLGFLTHNHHLNHLQALASQVVQQDPSYANAYPFNDFINGNIPGQKILVYRQMYEVVKRLKLSDKFTDKRLILFQKDPNTPSGFDVKFLAPLLQRIAAKARHQSKTSSPHTPSNNDLGLDNKAVAITFTLRNSSNQTADIMQQPVPTIKLVNCPNQQTWSKLLWKLNQPDAQGRQRYTILIHNKYDLTRLRRALLVKQVVKLNSAKQDLTLKNYTVGRLLLLPSLDEKKVRLIDSDVAKYFFLDEQYYPALQAKLGRAIHDLDQALRKPSISQYLNQPLNDNANQTPSFPDDQGQMTLPQTDEFNDFNQAPRSEPMLFVQGDK